MIITNSELIVNLREACNYTQKNLADKSGISLSTVRDIESGRVSLSESNALKLSNLFDINVNFFYKEEIRNTIVIGFGNPNGGCGKTSLIANLGYTLSTKGKKVLLIDASEQMNLSQSFGIFDKEGFLEENEKHYYNAFVKNEDLLSYITKTRYENLDIVIGSYKIGKIESYMHNLLFKEIRAREILDEVIQRGIYDFIIYDTSSPLSSLHTSIYYSCDSLIVPIYPSHFGIDGATLFMKYFSYLKGYRRDLSSNLCILGIIFNKIDKRESWFKSANDVVDDRLRHLVFNTYIPIDANINNAQACSIPLFEFAPYSRAVASFNDLANEIITRAKNKYA